MSNTINQLREMLSYNPETGIFTWKVKRRGRGGVGVKAGSVNTHPATGRKYIYINTLGKQWKSHRLAWWFYYGEECDSQIDHINGDGTDNRITNLRKTNPSENARNARRRNTNIGSGVTGVRWYKPTSKWIAGIHNDGKNVHLGTFVNFDDAVKARKEAEIKYGYSKHHGEIQQL